MLNTRLILVLFLTLACFSANASDANKVQKKLKGDLSIVVLGSGGPMATSSARAGASYLVYVEGQPRILMDAGGGTYTRLAESGANIKDLDIVLLSHLHIDHTGDLSSMIKTAYFHKRAENVAQGTFPPGRVSPFKIFGPMANNTPFPPVLGIDSSITQYPSASDYVDQHYHPEHGTERYLNIFSRAISGGIFSYEAIDVPADWRVYQPTILIDEDGLRITAVGVNHGPVPALAFRIDYNGKSIVYSGDTSSVGSNMISLSEKADVLIYDTAITDSEPSGPNDGVFFSLHTTPSRMGEVATESQVRQLVLSHITPITEPRLNEVKQRIKQKGFGGKISVAKDLKVINISD